MTGYKSRWGVADGKFESATLELPRPASGVQPGAGGWLNQDLYPRYLADVNNDGRIDIVGFAADGVHVALVSVDYFV